MRLPGKNTFATGPQELANRAQEHLFHSFSPSEQSLQHYFAPGRVNLIGEHIDYNGGVVFPCAVNHGVAVAIRSAVPDKANRIRFCSTGFEDFHEIDLKQPLVKVDDGWYNYPVGVIRELLRCGLPVGGCDISFSGDLPGGSGLSSSAAIEVATAFAVNDLFDLGLGQVEIARLCQKAENEFVGVTCGIMDQFAVAACRHNHALKLDCNTLAYEQVPLNLGNSTFIISNTNQSRELAEGAYNQRVDECARALSIVSEHRDADNLADLLPSELLELEPHFASDAIAYSRASHVVSEQQRVMLATEALESNNLEEFGRLMTASHVSLRDLYEVSSHALDSMVDAALSASGTLGSRLTGAGFGGCTVSLVANADIESWIAEVGDGYRKRIELVPEFYAFQPGDGVCEVGGISPVGQVCPHSNVDVG